MVALVILVFSLIFIAGSVALKVGTMAQPGAGFMPAVVGAGLLVAAAYNVVQRFRQRAAKGGDRGGILVVPIGIAAATLVFPIMLRSLDYLLSTFLVMTTLLLVLRFKSPLVAVITAFTVSLASFLFFGKLLGVVLPSGVLEDAILAL